MALPFSGRRAATLACAALVAATLAASSSCEDFRAGPSDAADDADASASPFVVVQTGQSTESLLAVWGADATHVFAVGTNDVRYEFDGVQWSRWDPVVVGRDFHSVWGLSATDVYAAGEITGTGQGVVSHYDGASWRDEYVAPTPLYSVWGDGTVVLAVGPKGMLYGKAQGSTAWAMRLGNPLPPNPDVPQTADDPVLWGIAGKTGDEFALAAGVDRIFHWEPPNFVPLDPVVDKTRAFRSVFVVPGSQPTTYVFGTTYLGLTWLANSGPPDADIVNGAMFDLYQDRGAPNAVDLFIHGIWGESARVVFVGDASRIGVYDPGANEVTTVPSPIDGVSFGGVWGSSMSDLWIVGSNETILHGAL
jgi:hypothetical protein